MEMKGPPQGQHVQCNCGRNLVVKDPENPERNSARTEPTGHLAQKTSPFLLSIQPILNDIQFYFRWRKLKSLLEPESSICNLRWQIARLSLRFHARRDTRLPPYVSWFIQNSCREINKWTVSCFLWHWRYVASAGVWFTVAGICVANHLSLLGDG